MKKLGRNSLAVGVATLLVTAAVQFSANGASGDVAQSNSSAITATGLPAIIDSDQCTAESADGTPNNGTGTCGVGLGVSQPAVTSFDQTASTSLDGNKGVSTADAQVAGTGIDALTTIDLSSVPGDLGDIDTGTVLDPILQGGLDGLSALLLVLGIDLDQLLDQLTSGVQDAIVGPLTTALQNALPVSVEIGAVSSTCDAVAGQDATGSSSVAGIDIIVDLGGGNTITVPVDLDTDANSALVGSVAPQQLVDGILDGLEDTLTTSITGALGGVADLIDNLQSAVIDPILAQVGTALLDPVGQALSPILNGTVNKQVVTDGAIEVTALELNVLGQAAHLALARTSCGPNTLAAADQQDDSNAVTDSVTDADTDSSDADTDSSDADTNADAIADADSAADADATAALPDAGAPNLLPFFLLGFALVAFGAAVLVNERRRMNHIV